MFCVDRLTKCRTRSGSVNSGKGGGESAIAQAGNSDSTGVSGTSPVGIIVERRPARDCSKSSCVARVLRMDCIALPRARRTYSSNQAVDLFLSALFRDCYQQAILQIRIPFAEWNAGK